MKVDHAYVQEAIANAVIMSNHKAVICGVARTPIGRFLGTLSSLTSIDLGVAAVKELCHRVGFDPSTGISRKNRFQNL